MHIKKHCSLILLICTAFCAQAQINKPLAKTIDSMYDADQNVQLKILALTKQNAPEDSIKQQKLLKLETYRRDLEIVKNIYQQYGYPTANMVGMETSHHYFILIQHADFDPQFQLELLPVLDKYSLSGDISRKDYAYLYDRVLLNTGGKQLYGTQPDWSKGPNLFDSNNKIILPRNCEDLENVDKRRAAVGLAPVEAYYEEVMQALGRPRAKQ